MLKWSMADIVGVIINIFTGAGQSVPSITRQYAQKAKVSEADGMVIEGGAKRAQRRETGIYTMLTLLTVTVACSVLSIFPL
jgi:hypothetical protein